MNNHKIVDIYNALLKTYGYLECPLVHKSPFELLIAVMLSAQCTDKKVNSVTPKLFKNYPDVKSLKNIKIEKLAEIIRPIGLFRVKSANIIKACEMIASDFDGKVPKTMQELISLPGVGRKTANVILGNAFGIPGFPVDTHVIRLTNRIGLVKTKDPVKIEKAITSKLPDKYWTDFSHLLITHGRQRCPAAKPDCENCEIKRFCKKIGLKKK